MSKLYTEEQVRKAIALGYDWYHQKHIPDDFMIDNFINSLTPIELPKALRKTDVMLSLPTVEEIELWAKEQAKIEPTGAEEFGRIWGAMWMRDKIKGCGDE
jgi:hypothetical protein